MLKIKKLDRKLAIIAVTVMVIILFFSGFSIGKEISKTDLETIANIATPILKVENGEQVKIDNNTSKGTYEFTIKNYDEENNITQVNMEYYIEILTQIDQNVSFKIYKEDTELAINDNRTEKFVMHKNNKQDDKYKIEIMCDEEKKLDSLIQEIQIKVYSEQKRS